MGGCSVPPTLTFAHTNIHKALWWLARVEDLGVAKGRVFWGPFGEIGCRAASLPENVGSLAWLLDTTATGTGAVRTDTWRRNEAERDRFRRRNCTPAP